MIEAISTHISDATGETFIAQSRRSVGGGSINDALVLSDASRHYFVKLNQPSLEEMFVAEAEGLRELASANAIKVPEPVCYGQSSSYSYIVMEYIQMGSAKAGSHKVLGEQLAALHRKTHARFGWHRDNTIGSTNQPNPQTHDWIEFWNTKRLGFQLQLAKQHGYGNRLISQGEKLQEKLPLLFSTYTAVPSLLHGDLWSGNYGFDSNGMPVIFDPAVYYGDREADIAMTELFGGFTHDFYDAYNEHYPLDEGYPVRKTLYNLYHILNHLNLFGSGYLSQSENMIQRLLAEL